MVSLGKKCGPNGVNVFACGKLTGCFEVLTVVRLPGLLGVFTVPTGPVSTPALVFYDVAQMGLIGMGGALDTIAPLFPHHRIYV